MKLLISYCILSGPDYDWISIVLSRRLKRQLKVSNRSLKKSGAISWGNMSQMSVASPDELFSISNMWKSYIRNLLKSCKSVAHYQARCDAPLKKKDLHIFS